MGAPSFSPYRSSLDLCRPPSPSFRPIRHRIPVMDQIENGERLDLRGFANLPGWADFPVRAEIEQRLHTQVVLENDAKVVELAEMNPKEPWTLDALTQVITQEYWLDNYSSHPGWGKDSRQARAIAILLRDRVWMRMTI